LAKIQENTALKINELINRSARRWKECMELDTSNKHASVSRKKLLHCWFLYTSSQIAVQTKEEG